VKVERFENASNLDSIHNKLLQ